MTVAKLYKILEKMIAEGHARKRVCVSKQSFAHPLEGDGVCIMDVSVASIDTFPVADDDGGWKFRKDGCECSMTVAVLRGGAPDVTDVFAGGREAKQ